MLNNLLAATSAESLDLKDVGDFKDLTGLTLPVIIAGIIKFTLIIAALIFFFMLVIGGIKWIASGGDKGATEGARNQITAALVGLVIVFAAWAIISLIKTFFGIDIFTLNIPQLNG